MSNASPPDRDAGGVNIPGTIGSVGGDIVGRDKTTVQVVIENLYYSQYGPQPTEKAETGDEAIGPCPYPGLAYFGPDDAARFFGRDGAVERLTAAVDRQSFVALVGASGSGKSSVVLAGLAPRLAQAGGWRFTHFRTGSELEHDPYLALARALVPLFMMSQTEVDRIANTNALSSRLRSGELTLSEVFAECRSRNQGSRILLIADQFEEIFTLVPDESVRERFIGMLLAGMPRLAAGERPDICLMLTLRADFYGHALLHRPLADALQGHVENLGPMNRLELRTAILRPAEIAGVSFEAGLPETMLTDVESTPGSLPLLQFALREMWGRQQRRVMTRSSYEAIGGVQGAVAQRAERIFKRLTANGTDTRMAKDFQQLFARLVTPGEGREDTRRVAERRELGEEIWALAQRLAGEGNRLVVTNAPTPAHETAEVVHEALIRQWPRLASWIDQDRVFLSWLRQFRSIAGQWLADPTDDGALLRGALLAQAEDWSKRRDDDFSPDERRYVKASLALREREAEEREAKRRAEIVRQQELAEAARKLAEEQRQRARTARRLGGAAGFAAILAVSAAVVAGGLAVRAEHARLAAEAQTAGLMGLQDFEAGRGISGLVSALRGARSLQALVGNDDALTDYPATSPLLALQVILDGIYEKNRQPVPDQQKAADPAAAGPPAEQSCEVLGDDGKTTPLSGLTKDAIRLLMGHDSRGVLAWGCAPNGQYIVSTGVDGTVRLRSATTRFPARLIGLHGGATRITFQPDSAGFTTQSVWEIVSWAVPMPSHIVPLTPPAPTRITSTAFSPTGALVAVGYADGTVHLWTASGGEPDTPIRPELAAGGSRARVIGMHFDANGSHLSALGYDGTLKTWQSSGGPPATATSAPNVISAAFSSDAAHMATAQAGGSVVLLDRSAAEPAIVSTGHRGWVFGLDFSPDGSRLATGGADGKVTILDLSGHVEGKPIVTGQEQVMAVAFGPKTGDLISTGSNGTVKLWDAGGRLLTQFVGHQAKVLTVSVNRQGSLIATSDVDGKVRLWLPSGAPVAILPGQHGTWATEVSGGDFGAAAPSFGPDGRTLIVPLDDGRAEVWRLPHLEELIKHGCDWLHDYRATHPTSDHTCG